MTYRILSLDGGGIRGIITAIWLAALEDRLGRKQGVKLRDYFDLVAGTSTGSILAAAIVLGIPASDVAALYEQRGREVFPATGSRWLNRWLRIPTQGPSAPKYDGRGLRDVLLCVFGATAFRDIATQGPGAPHLLIPAYDLQAREPVVFKSHKPEHAAVSLAGAVHASCAAPTYFPCCLMSTAHEDVLPLIDGGIVANNPTLCAVAEAVKLGHQLDEIVVVSVGTGATKRPITADQGLEWGALEWAIPLYDVLLDGPAQATDYIAEQLLGARYHRFQTPLDIAYDDLDDASGPNLVALGSIAEGYLCTPEGEAKLDRAVELLTEASHA